MMIKVFILHGLKPGCFVFLTSGIDTYPDKNSVIIFILRCNLTEIHNFTAPYERTL